MRPSPLFAVAFAGLAAVGAAGAFLARRHREPTLPVLGTLPRFSLTERNGRTLARSDLAGPWVADFIFTRCGGICPAMTARMSRLRKDAPPGTRFVSFTVDPAHDTPDVLAAYARDFHAGEDWLFVTGGQQALYDLATNGFKLGAFEVPPDQQKAGGDGPFLHSSKFVLVDGGGRIRGYYDSTDEAAVTRLASDLRRLESAAP